MLGFLSLGSGVDIFRHIACLSRFVSMPWAWFVSSKIVFLVVVFSILQCLPALTHGRFNRQPHIPGVQPLLLGRATVFQMPRPHNRTFPPCLNLQTRFSFIVGCSDAVFFCCSAVRLCFIWLIDQGYLGRLQGHLFPARPHPLFSISFSLLT